MIFKAKHFELEEELYVLYHNSFEMALTSLKSKASSSRFVLGPMHLKDCPYATMIPYFTDRATTPCKRAAAVQKSVMFERFSCPVPTAALKGPTGSTPSIPRSHPRRDDIQLNLPTLRSKTISLPQGEKSSGKCLAPATPVIPTGNTLL